MIDDLVIAGLTVGQLYATEEDYAKADECENHWMHIVKVICIVGKIAIVVIMMAIAIRMYTIKY